MTNNNKQSPNLLKFFTVFVLLLGAVGGYFYYAQRKVIPVARPSLPPKILTDGLISIAIQIQKRFEEGDVSLELKNKTDACLQELGNVKNVDSLYTRCNPDFLQCFYSGKLGDFKRDLSFNFEGKNYLAEIIPYSSNAITKTLSRTNAVGTFLPSFGYEMKLHFKEFPESVLTFSIEDSCKDSFLPRRKYAYGEEIKKELLEWDNLDSNIFVDKFLVSNRDIREWVNSSGVKVSFDKDNLAYPVLGLKPFEMKNYCAFHGKRLLEAHIFDAARFLPTDVNDTEPIKVKRGPYYWTKDSKQTFLAKKDKNLLNQENCRYAYIAECLKIIPFDPYYSSPTWMGINQALGGVTELYRNPLFPQKNLKLSSFKFGLNGNVHVIGKHDSAEAFDEDEAKFGFRCMSVSPFIVRENDEEK